MANYQTVQIGRLVMREDFAIKDSAALGQRTITLTGQESMPRHRLEAVKQRREDFLALIGKFVPVAFTEKSDFDGFYYVDSAKGTIENWDGELGMFAWSANLFRVGSVGEVDIESKLSGPISRINDFSVIGSRVHAPAIGHDTYNSGSTVPVFVDRESVDGIIRVYRNLADDIHPRWGISPESYGAGRVRFIDDNGLERAGESFNCPAFGWELNNGLIRVRPTDPADSSELISNTGFETNTSGWTSTGSTLTRSTAQFRSGVASGLVEPDGVASIVEATAADVPVAEGDSYVWYVWMYSPDVLSGLRMRIVWRDELGSDITSDLTAPTSIPAATWTRLEIQATAVAGAESASPRIQITGTPADTVDLYLDDASFTEKGRTLLIDSYDSGAWSSKIWDIITGTSPAVSMAPFDYCSMLHNTQEMVAIRLTKDLAPGRSTVDLILKRGYRFVELYIQHQFGTTLKIARSAPETGTVPPGAGYVEAGSADADGNKYIIGSARTFTADTLDGGLSKDATSTLDAFVGIELSGDSAAAGDESDELYRQYIGSPAETVLGVRR